MSKWFQSFYGKFQTLLPWTSTDTSINIVGSAFKDALFAVDDLKMQNFRSDNDAKKVMSIIQNYSDGTGRQRANIDLKLRDERIIQGHLLISAEDLVVTESSSIARGIVISVNSKKVKFDKLSEINEASDEFSSFTPHFIQYILSNYDEVKVEEIFSDAIKFIQNHPHVKDPNISQDNLPRMINNFTALKTSWQVLSDFLFIGKPDKQKYQEIFDKNLILLLLDNIERISSYKSEVVFEQSLWEMLENGTFSLTKVLPNGDYDSFSINYKSKNIGYYSEDKSGNINLVLQLSSALREMKKVIPNFAISEDTLKIKLMNDNKIKVNPSKKVSLNGKKISGVQWVGHIPKSIFGIKETEDSSSQAAEIISSSKPDHSRSLNSIDFPFKKKEVVEDIYF